MIRRKKSVEAIGEGLRNFIFFALLCSLQFFDDDDSDLVPSIPVIERAMRRPIGMTDASLLEVAEASKLFSSSLREASFRAMHTRKRKQNPKNYLCAVCTSKTHRVRRCFSFSSRKIKSAHFFFRCSICISLCYRNSPGRPVGRLDGTRENEGNPLLKSSALS